MKTKSIVFIILVLSFNSCKKTPTVVEDPHNHSLTGKTLDQIRAEIRGDWYIIYSVVCGVTGCQISYSNINSAQILSFLSNDTIKQTAHAGFLIYFYQKADSVKASTSYFTRLPTWTFFYSLQDLTFTKVYNDTLIAEVGQGEIGLIKKS